MDGGPKIIKKPDSNTTDHRLKPSESSSIELNRMEISKDKLSGKDASSAAPYNPKLLNSKLQAQLINEFQHVPDLNSNSYLSDNELHFL